uniref:tRNA-uridine aminocarboxypropyltransferase 1 n=1 Tax=Panstrongylus megistus TaxID=65343 RepID=A0A069DYE1_9HEMI
MDSKNVVNDENPFENLKISESWINLHQVGERTICPQCNKSRKYFCYTCYLPVSEIKDYVPHIKLPLKVDIIKHAREIDGKSTAVHAAVLCPNDVTVYTYPAIPSYDILEKTILVFPSPNAESIEELIRTLAVDNEHEEHKPYENISRVVFIDSTWNQSRGIYKDPRLFKLPCVIIKKRITQFWRHQNGVPRWHLSTIEAIHQFFVEYDIIMEKIGNELALKEKRKDLYDHNDSNNLKIDNTNEAPHSGKFDDLLFFFRFMYDKIHSLYDHSSLKSYKRPLE